MAQGERASTNSNHRGKDWVGKRPLSYHPVSSRPKTNKFFKRLTHKIERQQGKQLDE